MIKKHTEIFGKFFATSTFINWTPDMTSGMIGYIKDLILDLSPLLLPIIAIGIGLIIVGAILRAIRG